MTTPKKIVKGKKKKRFPKFIRYALVIILCLLVLALIILAMLMRRINLEGK